MSSNEYTKEDFIEMMNILKKEQKFQFPEYFESGGVGYYNVSGNGYFAVVRADDFCRAMQEAAKNFNPKDDGQ